MPNEDEEETNKTGRILPSVHRWLSWVLSLSSTWTALSYRDPSTDWTNDTPTTKHTGWRTPPAGPLQRIWISSPGIFGVYPWAIARYPVWWLPTLGVLLNCGVPFARVFLRNTKEPRNEIEKKSFANIISCFNLQSHALYLLKTRQKT